MGLALILWDWLSCCWISSSSINARAQHHLASRGTREAMTIRASLIAGSCGLTRLVNGGDLVARTHEPFQGSI